MFSTSQYVRALRETLRRLGVEPDMVTQLTTTRGDDDCGPPVAKRPRQGSAATTSQRSRSNPPPWGGERGGDCYSPSSSRPRQGGETTGYPYYSYYYWYYPGPCSNGSNLQCQLPAAQAAWHSYYTLG